MSNQPNPLKSGAKRARGGKREGSGRKPDWLKQKCANLIDKKKLLEYVARVASGDEIEKVVIVTNRNGAKENEIEEIPCSTRDRLHAFEILCERGFGKPVQGIEHTGSIATTWNIVIEGAK